jgi:hypothetical protein
MDISTLLQTTPEETDDEALRSIDSIMTFPAKNSARVRCFLSQEFRLSLHIRPDATVEITAEGRKPVFCTPAGLVPALRRTIFEIDAALAEGSFTQTKPRMTIISDEASPPPSMDIPIWDESPEDRQANWDAHNTYQQRKMHGSWQDSEFWRNVSDTDAERIASVLAAEAAAS